jgi:cell wall-active antibiotic response 4TMS protein YvqF/B-box zinc finger protein
MKCAVHAEVDATGFCRNCGKALCPQCTREVQGALYCEECLAKLVASPPQRGGHPNPGAAFWLGWVPGLGAVYNGEYIKALIHVLIFGGIIALLNSEISEGSQAMLGILLGAFCIYMPFEALNSARAIRAGKKPAAFFGEGESGRPIGAYVLIGIGVIFLLFNFDVLHFEWFARSWPLILIALGGYLLWCRTKGR